MQPRFCGMRLTSSASAMPGSGIRDIMNAVATMPEVINLAPGEPNFPTPRHIVDAGIRALEEGHTKYVHNAGIPPLREELVRKLKEKNNIGVGPDEIIVTHGAMGALNTAFAALVGPGDEVLVPDPSWPNFNMIGTLRSATVRPYPLSVENGFLPDVDRLRQLTSPATTLILINTPLNPVGSMIEAELMTEILEFAREHDLWVVSDETYEFITFSEGFVSAASLGYSDRVIGVYSFSKTYSMTGWRVGYMVAPPAVAPTFALLQEAMISCVNSPAQWAALAALTGPQDVVGVMRDAYFHRRQLALEILQAHGVPAHPPVGAFYLWVDVRGGGVSSAGFAQSLLEQHQVAVVPGTDFGAEGEGWVRVSLAAAPEEIRDGVERLARHHNELGSQ